MINKFKDFLKKISAKRNQDSSDQDELLDEELSDETLQDDEANFTEESSEEEASFEEESPVKASWKDKLKVAFPTFARKKKEIEAEEVEEDIPPLDEEVTGSIPLPSLKPSWKDKLKGALPSFKKSKPASEDHTGPLDLDSYKPSLKDKLSSSVTSVKDRLGHMNVGNWKLPERVKSSKSSEGLVLLSPSLSRSIEKFLSQDARENIHQTFLVVLICAFTYTLGKITALSLRGAPVPDAPKEFAVNLNLEDDFNPGTLGQVRSINIFRTNTGLGTKKRVADTKCESSQQTSNLPIKLVNTVVLQDQVKSLASVQVRGDRDLQEVRVGDQISNLAKIFKIDRLEILIRNLESGVCESIASDAMRDTRRSPISVMSPSQSRQYVANKKMPGIENQGNKFVIEKKLLENKLKDIASILTQARAIKIQNPDGTMAFKLTEMDPQGIFPYLGLQDQDIITSINGKPIYDMNEVMGLFSRIKNLDKLQLGIKREGSESVLDYNIKK